MTKITHGYRVNRNLTKTYTTWQGMLQRCNNPNVPNYKYYGGQGVKVCKRWNNYVNFLKDMGEKPEGLSIDRIDTYGDYKPKNCHWATPKQQTNNRRYPKRRKPNPLMSQINKKSLREMQKDIAALFDVHLNRISFKEFQEIWHIAPKPIKQEINHE